MSEGADDKLRLDKWLWYARFFKSRTLAAEAVSGGRVRVNRQPVRKPGHGVKAGDVLTFVQGRQVRVIEVLALGSRRGPAPEARALYSDLDPPQPREAAAPLPSPHRDPGAGRPTKKDRRAIDSLKH